MSISMDGVKIVSSKGKRKNKLFGFFIAGAEIVLTFFFYLAVSGHILFPDSPASAATGSPNLLSYEGYLADASGNPLGGTGTTYCFRFSIYDAQTSGTKLWPSGTPSSNSVTVTDGVFSALIGQADTLDYNFYDNDTTYLNVEVNATATTCGGSWQTLGPRQRIASSGYSISTENVYGSLLQTITASSRVQLGTGAGGATPIRLGLDVKNTEDVVGGSCTTSGTMWYNSAVSKALICENSVIQAISNAGATTTIASITANASAGASTGTVAFSNSNGITFGINGNTITASASSVVFSNAAGQNITFGLNGSTLTASVANPGGGAGATVSYYENNPWFQGAATSAVNVSNNSIWVAPFVLPVAISASYLRVPVSLGPNQVSASHASTANTSFSLRRFQTDAFVIYSQGVGASSRSLQSVTSGSAGWTLATTISHGAQSSQQTVHFNITYPIEGGNASNYTTSFGQSSASYVNSTGSLTLFSGLRWVDIPFAGSLSPGNYWIGFGRSTTTSTQVSIASTALLLGSIGFSTAGISQIGATTVGLVGLNTNSSVQMQPGLGWWTNAAAVSTTASIGLTNISNISGQPKPYFQFIRQS